MATKMDVQDMVKCVITAALAYGAKYKKDAEAEQADMAELSEGEREEQELEFPEEQDDEDFWEAFTDYVEGRGLEHFDRLAVAGEDAGKIVDRILNKTP